MDINRFETLSLEIRKDIILMLSFSRRGHVASAFSIVEILICLYFYSMRHNPKIPNWEERDRFILSKGHGCMALYAVLAKCGYFDSKRLTQFCQHNGQLGGHPKRGDAPGIEASTGSLGQGISVAVGIALSLKLRKSTAKVFVVLGDGECEEGSVWEAALSASKNQLSNLVVLIDYNKYQSYDEIKNICPLEPFDNKWFSFGFDVSSIDMVEHPKNLIPFLLSSPSGNKPKAILCHTIKGQGNLITENNLQWHHKNNVTDLEIEMLYKGLE